MWNLKPSGKVMNIAVQSRNCILLVINGGLRVDWLEQHHIIHRKLRMSYLCLHYKVSLVDLFGRVNFIGL